MAFRFRQQQPPLNRQTLYQQQQPKQEQLQQKQQQQQKRQPQQLPQLYRYSATAKPIKLFVDDDFKARWDSLFCPFDAVGWMRPHEVRPTPNLFVKGTSRFDVIQGLSEAMQMRGPFLAACAALAERPELLNKVIPEGQVLFGPGYDGSVKFRFWDLGTWKEVQIDDRLPVNAKGKPVYAHCKNDDEFWVPLLEKAFYRLYGNKYGADVASEGGFCEGIMRLTGFSVETLSVKPQKSDECFEAIEDSLENDALVLLGTGYMDGPGIPFYQAYTVTKTYRVKEDENDGEELHLVRVRNPWGNEVEWSGAWGDGDERWDKLNKATLRAMDYRNNKDGEFWIEMKDLSSSFTVAIIASEKPRHCEHLNLIEEFKYKEIEKKTEEDEEKENEESEGKEENEEKEKIDSKLKKFLENPQFLLWTVGTGEQAGSCSGGPNGSSREVEICVEMKHIGSSEIYIFEVPDVSKKLTQEVLRAARPVAVAKDDENMHDRHSAGSRCLLRLQPGRRYVVVARCFRDAFLMRLFASHERVFMRELTA